MSVVVVIRHFHPISGEEFRTFSEQPDRAAGEAWLRQLASDGWLDGEVSIKVVELPDAWETIDLPAPAIEGCRITHTDDGLYIEAI